MKTLSIIAAAFALLVPAAIYAAADRCKDGDHTVNGLQGEHA